MLTAFLVKKGINGPLQYKNALKQKGAFLESFYGPNGR